MLEHQNKGMMFHALCVSVAEITFVMSDLAKSINAMISAPNSLQDFSLENSHWKSIESHKYVPD